MKLKFFGKVRFWILVLVAGLAFSACDSQRVYEQHKEFGGGKWLEDSLATFDFKIDDASAPFNIYYTVRSNQTYPYCNLYVTYYLYTAAGKLLSSTLHDIPLADPITGEPYGEGMGDKHDFKLLALPNYKFPKAGNYKIRVKQYMRQNPINGIEAFGVRIEKAEK